jgi:NTP pyrophosphatase (non-canonical NTP hydrolase)
MKCKIIFDTKTVPTFEDFEKSSYEYDACSLTMIIEKACKHEMNPVTKGYLLTNIGHQCYRFEYFKARPGFEHSFVTQLIGELKASASLTFETLRKANIARLPEFKNSKGLPAHSKPDGSDWSSAQWLQAVIGELGEYANVMKKVERGDLTFDEAKPLIEKELADVMTYLDILAFRVDVDLSKAVQEKFNEVSERVGCSLRIENNEVVRREKTKFAETKEELQEELAKIKENVRVRIQSGRTKCGTSIFENYDYNPKNGELTPKLTNEELKTYNKASGTITNITVQTTNSVINEDVTLSINMDDEIKVSIKPKMTDEEFKAAKEACRIPKEQAKEIIKNWDNFVCFDLFRQIYHQEWVEQCKQHAYPLYAKRNEITDIFGFEFQNLDTLKQYLFYQVKEMVFENDCIKYRYPIKQSLMFDYFSKQLGTKIAGMLINGHKENKILNPNDTVQFYDERNVLWNFRLVKASDKNVEVSET